MYDDHLRGDESATFAFPKQLARAGPALELVIGTGRIALALAARGIRVGGIDSSSPIVTRYAWPSELDLMARIAGLLLKARRDGWNREPFTATSATHVSVYGRGSAG